MNNAIYIDPNTLEHFKTQKKNYLLKRIWKNQIQIKDKYCGKMISVKIFCY